MGILIQLHSFLRWIVLILLLTAIIKSLSGMISKRAYTGSDNKISLFLLISTHTQLLVGLALYFISPWVQFSSEAMKAKEIRFYTMEHLVMMLIAVALITIGHVSSRKATTDAAKFKKAFWFFFIALVVIFAAIPWPFMPVARPWF